MGYCLLPKSHRLDINDNVEDDLVEWEKDSKYYKVWIRVSCMASLRPPDKPRKVCAEDKGDGLGRQILVCVSQFNSSIAGGFYFLSFASFIIYL